MFLFYHSSDHATKTEQYSSSKDLAFRSSDKYASVIPYFLIHAANNICINSKSIVINMHQFKSIVIIIQPENEQKKIINIHAANIILNVT
jgi:hypothetical protein